MLPAKKGTSPSPGSRNCPTRPPPAPTTMMLGRRSSFALARRRLLASSRCRRARPAAVQSPSVRPRRLTTTAAAVASNSSSGCSNNHSNPNDWREADFKLAGDVERRVLTPALVVSLPNVRHNIAAMVELCGGDVDRWRPHVKTTKMPLIWRELLRSGVRNFKCATVREARLLAATAAGEGVAGECDILVAFPLHGANLEALGSLATVTAGDAGATSTAAGPRLSCLVEGPEDIAAVPAGVGYFVDINPGMDRSGRTLALLRTQLSAFAAAVPAAAAVGCPFRGLHYYDGHSAQWQSGAPRRRALRPGYEDLVAFAAEFAAAACAGDATDGADGPAGGGSRGVPEIITSGTPSCTAALAFFHDDDGRKGLPRHRVSPGTTVFHDTKTREENDDLAAVLRPAAAVMVRVVSHPADGMFTVDAGSKALAAEVPAPIAVVLGAEAAAVAQGPSEEHLPFRVATDDDQQTAAAATAAWGTAARPARGDVLYLVPKHVCPTVNLAEKALVVDGDPAHVTEAEVAARAHDLWIQ